MFGLLVPKTTKEWQVRLPRDRCYGSPWQRCPLETDRHSELKMAIPNRSQFVSWKISHSLLKFCLWELVPSCFKPYKLVFKSQFPQTQTILQKDLLRQSSIQFLKSLFCSCWTFDIHVPIKCSAGLVIVSRFDIVSFTSFPFVQVKVVCGPEKVAVIQAGFCGERMCICVQKKKVLGLTRLVQILSSKVLVHPKRRCPWLGHPSRSLLCFWSSLSDPDVEFALG